MVPSPVYIMISPLGYSIFYKLNTVLYVENSSFLVILHRKQYLLLNRIYSMIKTIKELADE